MYYVNNRNIKIAVYDLNPTCKNVIVLVHGWPLSERIFDYQKLLLVNHGFRVITMDLRGYGNSDAPACGYSYNEFASDIDTIVRKLNLKSFILVGFSMGGAIVCRYMRLYQGYGVKKLCLLSAAVPRFTQTEEFPYNVTKEYVNELICQASTDRAELSKSFSEMLLYCEHSNEIKNWFKDISLGASQIGTIGGACSLRDEDCTRDVCSIQVPTGIFHGTRDEVVSYELGILQHKMIQTSQLFTFECSGHGVFYDELENFNCCFLDFVMH